MNNRNIDPEEIDWNRMSALIVRRVNVMQQLWQRSKIEFDDEQYRTIYFNIFLPLLASLLVFLRRYDKFIEERDLDRLH